MSLLLNNVIAFYIEARTFFIWEIKAISASREKLYTIMNGIKVV